MDDENRKVNNSKLGFFIFLMKKLKPRLVLLPNIFLEKIASELCLGV